MRTIGCARTGVAIGILVLLAACGGSGQPEQAGLEQVAQIIARGENRVTAEELARWIIEGRKDFVLIDIRQPVAYGKEHIEGAESRPVTELVRLENRSELPKERRVVLYSQGSEQAAQAATLLRLAGYDSNLLDGGYAAWQAQVLHPALPQEAAPDESKQQREQRAIACYFAGGDKVSRAGPHPSKQRGRAAFKPSTRPAKKGARRAPPPAEEGC